MVSFELIEDVELSVYLYVSISMFILMFVYLSLLFLCLSLTSLYISNLSAHFTRVKTLTLSLYASISMFMRICGASLSHYLSRSPTSFLPVKSVELMSLSPRFTSAKAFSLYRYLYI